MAYTQSGCLSTVSRTELVFKNVGVCRLGVKRDSHAYQVGGGVFRLC